MLIDAALVFLAFVCVDFTYARYTIALATDRVGPAMLWAALIPLFSGYVAIQYVANHWMLVPAALGGAAGTWLGMKARWGLRQRLAPLGSSSQK